MIGSLQPRLNQPAVSVLVDRRDRRFDHNDLFRRVVIVVTRFGRILPPPGEDFVVRRIVKARNISAVGGGQQRQEGGRLVVVPHPRSADHVEIAGVTAVDIGFPLPFCSFTSTPSFSSTSTPPRWQSSGGSQRCYTAASASADDSGHSPRQPQGFRPGIKLSLTHALKL